MLFVNSKERIAMNHRNEEEQEPLEDDRSELAQSVSTISLISGSFNMDNISTKMDNLEPDELFTKINDSQIDYDNRMETSENIQVKEKEEDNLEVFGDKKNCSNEAEPILITDSGIINNKKEGDTPEFYEDKSVRSDKAETLLISDADMINDVHSFSSLIEASKLLQSNVRNTRGLLDRQTAPNIWHNNFIAPKSKGNTSNTRNTFNGHIGGATHIVEVFQELIDSIISCVRDEMNDIDASKMNPNACFMPSLFQIPALSILFGHLREEIILTNEYYYSYENDEIDADLILYRFICLLDHMHKLALSISDVEYCQASTPKIEVNVFQIVLAVVGEGIFLIKQINSIVVKIKSQNEAGKTNEETNEVPKKEINTPKDQAQLHHRQQQRQRRNEGSIFRTSMNVINIDESNILPDSKISTKEMIDLWDRLAEWALNVEKYFLVYSSDSSNNDHRALYNDGDAFIALTKKIALSSSEPFGSITSSLATISEDRKQLSEASVLEEYLDNERDKMIDKSDRILIKSWNQVDIKETELLHAFDSGTIMRKKELMYLGIFLCLPSLYDIFFHFQEDNHSFISIYACFIIGLIHTLKGFLFGWPKQATNRVLFKFEHSPFTIMQSMFKKNSIVLPRSEIKKKVISTLISQARGNKKSNEKNTPPNTTILTGLPGCGTTTLAAMSIKSKETINHFYYGIVWLSLGPYPITYGGLIELYRRICSQLFKNSTSSFHELTQFHMHPENDEDEKDLMMKLRQDMIDLFSDNKKKWSLRSLIVIDGLNHIEDLIFFQFHGETSKSYEETNEETFLGPSILVTKNTTDTITSMTRNNEIATAEIIQVMPLSNDEVLKMFDTESTTVERHENVLFYESQMKKVMLEQCRRLPFYIKIITRLMKTRKDLYNEIKDVHDVYWENIYNFLRKEIDASYSYTGKMIEENRTVSFINLLFSADGIGSDGLGKILELCFSSLVVVFMDSSCFLNDHSNYSHNALFAPWTAVHVLWTALLDSDEVSNQEIVEFEHAFFHYQQNDNNQVITSRVSFIRSLLESMGIIQSICYKSEEDPNILRGIFVPNESLKLSAENLMIFDVSEEEEGDYEFDRKEREWNILFIRAYEKKFKKHKLSIEVLSTVGIDQINEDELTFLLQYLPHHLIAAGMMETAGRMLAGCGFVKNRLNYIGIVNGTKQQIKDAELLLEMSRKDAENYQDLRDRTQKIDFVAAKSSVVMGFEHVVDHLHEHINSIESDEEHILDVSSLLHALGCSIQRQGWRNEAFVFFQEALFLSKNIFLSDEASSSLLQLLVRTLFSVGLVSFENNDYVEAIKDLTEAVEYLSLLDDAMNRTRFAADLHHNLGLAYYLKEDYEPAIDTLLNAIKIHGYVNTAPSIEKADIVYHIGKIEQNLGNLDDAIKRYSECLHVKKKLLGYEHVDVARVLHALGDVCQERGDIMEAIRIYTEASHVWKSTYQGDNVAGIDYAHSLHNLGVLYRQKGMLSEAMQAYHNSLQIRKSILGSFHVDVAQLYHNIGIVHCENGAYDEAMKAYAKALRVREELLGTGSADFSNTLHNIGVVIRQKGDTDEARQAFMEALWVAKALDIDAPSADLLRERCAVLFGAKILDKCCVSSRIFACATLMVESMLTKDDNDSELNSVPSIMSWIHPMLPLLTAIVNSEIVALENPTENKRTDYDNYVKKSTSAVSFCSFDFSTIFMPVDITMESNAHLEACIQSLTKTLQEINQFCIHASKIQSQNQPETAEEKTNDENSVLTKMLLVFHAMSSHVDGNNLREVCSEVMPEVSSGKWPSSRFIKAAELYRDEFEAIVANIESRQEGVLEIETSIVTNIRQKLSIYLSSAIRFHLRRFFDPPPLGYTLPSDDHPSPDFSGSRSETHEMVWMASSEEKSSISFILDSSNQLYQAPISYVLNLAIRRIYEYFEAHHDILKITDKNARSPNQELKESAQSKENADLDPYPGLSSSSLYCLSEEASDLHIMNDNEVQEVIEDIMLAKLALSAANAGKFIYSLILWPGVKSCIREVGGWHSNVELFARIFYEHNLNIDNPEDGHLILLRDIDGIMLELEKEKGQMGEIGSRGEGILNLFWNRFKTESRQKKENANERIIRQTLVDDSYNLTFPLLVEPESDE